ncbi:MAG: alpha/beta fold hydrolase [Phycisphaerales bacterium]
MRRYVREHKRGLIWAGATLYLLLLVASHISQQHATMPVAPPADSQLDIPTMGRHGPEKSGPRSTGRMGMDMFEWEPRARSDDRLPVIMLHGSPGHGADFGFSQSPGDPTLVSFFTLDGRHVYAPNLPGFGDSLERFDTHSTLRDLFRLRFVPNYSSEAQARSVLAMMDELGIERAHVVGWSNGGYTAIHMADLAPERVASITMLASVGAQETEGSGSHLFEHAKYAFGLVMMGGAGELIPHFGLLASRAERLGWLWNFWDTDQRPAADIMRRLKTPTLILHGRHDFLAADWNAERHHELMPASRLVMIDASHFIPFLQTEQAAPIMLAHFARHDTPGVAPLTGYENLDPRPERAGIAALWDWVVVHARGVHWLIWVLVIAPLAWMWPRLTTVVVALLVAAMSLDFGVATAGLWAGALLGVVTDPHRRAHALCWLGALVKPLLALFVLWFISRVPPQDFARRHDLGLFALSYAWDGLGLLLAILLGVLLLAVVPKLLTPSGWRSLRNSLARARNHEWWPIWAIYLPLLPHLLRLAAKHRGLLVFTSTNPGMSHGGGFVGESKAEILEGLTHAGAAVMPAVIIEAGPSPEVRTDQALALIESREDLGALPIILKPDVGQNGADVRLARTPEDVRRYFHAVHAPVVVQRYHPGPGEAGVFWIRDSRYVDSEAPPGELTGRIYSITRKTLPEVRGDGRRTIRRLILAHKRCRLQAGALLDQLGERADEVPGDGVVIKIGQVGNHIRGAKFSDGADLITPELEHAIDEVARNFKGIDGGELDIGRFDVRFRSEDELRRGENLGVIELNGAGAEATNYYDPSRSVFWAWRVLAGQWTAAYELGALRRKQGVRPVSLGRFTLMALGWMVWRRRGGSASH